MLLGISGSLAHNSPEDWAKKHVDLGLKSVNFPVNYLAGEETYMAYKKAAEWYHFIITILALQSNN